jgi:GTPase SAR1 family protein
MGALLSLFSGRRRKWQIGIYGLDGAGKTVIFNHIMRQFLTNASDPEIRTAPTVEFVAHNVRLHRSNVVMWDMGGQQKFRVNWTAYLMSRDALIYVIDMNDVDRFHESVNALRGLLEACIRSDDVGTCLVAGRPIVVLLNKMDIFEERVRNDPRAFMLPEVDSTGEFVRDSLVSFNVMYAANVLHIVFRRANALRKKLEHQNTYHISACSATKCAGLKEPTKWLVDELYRYSSWSDWMLGSPE